MTGKELSNELTNFVNNYNCKEDEFINAFLREHRTLQQSSFRLILKLIDKLASDDYRTDGRNEATKKVAQQMIRGFKAEKKKELMKDNWSEEEADKFLENHCKASGYLGYV